VTDWRGPAGLVVAAIGAASAAALVDPSPWRTAGIVIAVLVGVASAALWLRDVVRHVAGRIARARQRRNRDIQDGDTGTARESEMRKSVAPLGPHPPSPQEQEVQALEEELKRLDEEYVAGRDILDRCDDDHAMDQSPNAATEHEADEWEQRVKLVLPADWPYAFQGAPPIPRPPGDPTSALAQRMESKLALLHQAITSRRQHLHFQDPSASAPPERALPSGIRDVL
jgi:hypothetical protein